jgi:hypothetical protein
LAQTGAVGQDAMAYCRDHLSANGMHWEDASRDRAGYSCTWTGRYWLLQTEQDTPRLTPVTHDEWRAAASEADNDFEYLVAETFDLSDRGIGVAGKVTRGSVLNGQTLAVIDGSGEVVTRVTAVVGFHGGLLLTGPGRHLVQPGHRLRHQIGEG